MVAFVNHQFTFHAIHQFTDMSLKAERNWKSAGCVHQTSQRLSTSPLFKAEVVAIQDLYGGK